jgi:hypothetical protein
MISIDRAIDRLGEINSQLKKHCKYVINISIMAQTQNVLLLELVNGEEICVSHIKCVINKTYLSINSYTPIEYRGNKYNLILRCVIVVICTHIMVDNIKIREIRSFALNIISENTIRKYFTHTKQDNMTFVIHCGSSKSSINKNSLELFYSLICDGKLS